MPPRTAPTPRTLHRSLASSTPSLRRSFSLSQPLFDYSPNSRKTTDPLLSSLEAKHFILPDGSRFIIREPKSQRPVGLQVMTGKEEREWIREVERKRKKVEEEGGEIKTGEKKEKETRKPKSKTTKTLHPSLSHPFLSSPSKPLPVSPNQTSPLSSLPPPLHPQSAPENQPSSSSPPKLSPSTILEIRRLRSSDPEQWSVRKLAKRYGVGEGVIRMFGWGDIIVEEEGGNKLQGQKFTEGSSSVGGKESEEGNNPKTHRTYTLSGKQSQRKWKAIINQREQKEWESIGWRKRIVREERIVRGMNW